MRYDGKLEHLKKKFGARYILNKYKVAEFCGLRMVLDEQGRFARAEINGKPISSNEMKVFITACEIYYDESTGGFGCVNFADEHTPSVLAALKAEISE